MSSKIAKKKKKDRKEQKNVFSKLVEWCKWGIPILYLIVSVTFVFAAKKIVYPLLISILETMKIGEIYVSNSEYSQVYIFEPFAESISLCAGVLISRLVLRKVTYKIKKDCCQQTKSLLKRIEYISVLVAMILLVYNVPDIEYNQYGYRISTIENALANQDVEILPLEKVPVIHSIGLDSSQASIAYRILYSVAQMVYRLRDNLEFGMALMATLIFSLKDYLDYMEKDKNK